MSGGAFSAGSVSLGLHPTGRDAGGIVCDLLELAVAADSAGFDGVTLGEHHAGYDGYLPNPLIACTWILERTSSVWAAAAPLLLGLRRPGAVIEDAAWTAARNEGRFGLAVAPGYVDDDFAAVGAEPESRAAVFRAGLPEVCRALGHGKAAGPLGRDAAVLACAGSPVPVLAATAGPVGVRRAAEAGAGILLGAFDPPARARELIDRYTAAGGTGPRVLIRRLWLGTPSADALAAMLGAYGKHGGDQGFLRGASADSILHAPDPAVLADLVSNVWRETGATALNVRLVMPGAGATEVRDQIARVGAEVLPAIERPVNRTGP